MLSHKKYNQLASGIATIIQDEQTTQALLELVKNVMNYSENQKTYNSAYYEKVKEKRRAGDQSWNDYQRKYHAQHKDELNERRRANYLAKKQAETH